MPKKKAVSPLDMPKTCATCRFFYFQDLRDEVGLCRRSPKQWVIDEDFVGWAYPEQEPNESCGEHKPVEQ